MVVTFGIIIANIINMIIKNSNSNFTVSGAIFMLVILLALLSPFIYFAGIKLLIMSVKMRKAIKNDNYEIVVDYITSFQGSHEKGTSDNYSTTYSFNLKDYTRRTKQALTLPRTYQRGDELILVYYKNTNKLLTWMPAEIEQK